MRDFPLIKPAMPDLKKVISSIEEIWDNNWYSNNGPFVKKLEQGIADFYNISVERVVTCVNATMGLTLAIRTLDWKEEVLTPYFTFPATLQAIFWNNLKYQYLDIDLKSHHATLNKEHFYRNKNLIVLFPYGCPKKYNDLDKYNSVVIDAAASFGNKSEAMLWSVENSDAIVFSLHATKLMGVGEGGFVIFKNVDDAKKFRRLSNFGFSSKRDILLGGSNAKMCEILAAIGLAKIEMMDEILSKISKNTLIFKKYLKDYESPIYVESYSKHPWQFIPVLLNLKKEERDKVMKVMLDEYGVHTGKYYEPLEYPSLRRVDTKLLNTLSVNQRIISLPIYTSMVEEDIVYIVKSLKKSIAKTTGRNSDVR